jgi:putative ABC transport system substrate-binding protein
LISRGVDIVLATGPEVALQAAIAHSGSRPIVMVAIDYDPIARGYIDSLAKPTRNITGVFFAQIELTLKRLQLFREAFPEVGKATFLWDAISVDQWRAAEQVSDRLGLELSGVELRNPPYEYESALDKPPAAYRRGLIVATSPFLFRDRAVIAQTALRRRALSLFVFREWVEAGGLMSYGPSLKSMYRRAADLTDRVARGTKPEDLPIEQPRMFELVINRKTALEVGIKLPNALLVRADELLG